MAQMIIGSEIRPIHCLLEPLEADTALLGRENSGGERAETAIK